MPAAAFIKKGSPNSRVDLRLEDPPCASFPRFAQFLFCALAVFAFVSTANASYVLVVEYYNAAMDHYFMTTLPNEEALLDAGQPPFEGWIRTGNNFSAFSPDGSPDATNVYSMCRFFNDSFAPKSSHFYALQSLGCEDTLADFPDWKLETSNLFRAFAPAGGPCLHFAFPLYRLYNNGAGGAPNHRYTISLQVRQEMIDMGWTPEGEGELGAVACVYHS